MYRAGSVETVACGRVGRALQAVLVGFRPGGGEPGGDLPAGAGTLRRDAVRDARPGACAFGATDALSAAGARLPGSADSGSGAALALALVAAAAGVHRFGAGDSSPHAGAGGSAPACGADVVRGAAYARLGRAGGHSRMDVAGAARVRSVGDGRRATIRNGVGACMSVRMGRRASGRMGVIAPRAPPRELLPPGTSLCAALQASRGMRRSGRWLTGTGDVGV